VVSKEAFQIVLHQSVEDAHHRGAAAGGQNREPPPPFRLLAKKIEDDAQETVDGDLGHHAAHQRRDMARRRRMGERQPDMERHEPGLRSRAKQGKAKDEPARNGDILCARIASKA